MAFLLIVGLILLQRLLEMRHGKRNLAELERELLAPVPQDEKLQMLILHTGFFLSLLLEFCYHGELVRPEILFPGLILLLAAQGVRFHTMRVLGRFWTTAPVAFKNQRLASHGAYRFIRHPNYLAVVIEILVIPLLGGCTITAVVFSLLNLAFLLRRIKMEEEALNQSSNYHQVFSMKKKLMPFIYTLALMVDVHAGTINLKTKDFEAAKQAESFFKFTGESTKLGLVTTSFEGYAREASLSFEEDGENLKNIVLEIKASSLDTDNGPRNEKMWEQSLSVKEFPLILVKIPELSLKLDSQEVSGELIIRNKITPIKIQIDRKEKSYVGKSSFKLSEAGVPDPGIVIASVNDVFRVDFSITMP